MLSSLCCTVCAVRMRYGVRGTVHALGAFSVWHKWHGVSGAHMELGPACHSKGEWLARRIRGQCSVVSHRRGRIPVFATSVSRWLRPGLDEAIFGSDVIFVWKHCAITNGQASHGSVLTPYSVITRLDSSTKPPVLSQPVPWEPFHECTFGRENYL